MIEDLKKRRNNEIHDVAHDDDDEENDENKRDDEIDVRDERVEDDFDEFVAKNDDENVKCCDEEECD
jgi:hypothetical protein